MDVLFMTDATAETGFGHAARCARLAGLLARRRPGLAVALAGTFTEDATRRLRAAAPARLVGAGEMPAARVGVYDTMVDPEDPEVWDAKRLSDLCGHSGRVVFFANGTRRPTVPDGVTVIGYKPGGPDPDPPTLLWGLDYAPVSADLLPASAAARDPASALVALGGARGSAGLRKVLGALADISGIERIDALESPVNPIDIEARWVRSDQQLIVHRSMPSVAPCLAKAGLVIASYGHLGYEALACGAPVCLVGQKRFQAEYAQRLAERGLCIAAGLLEATDGPALVEAIERCRARAETLSTAAWRAIDGKGLDRTADLLAGELAAAA